MLECVSGRDPASCCSRKYYIHIVFIAQINLLHVGNEGDRLLIIISADGEENCNEMLDGEEDSNRVWRSF